MMSIKIASRFVLGVVFFSAAGGLSPAMANPGNKSAPVDSAAVGSGSRTSVPAKSVRYCVTESDETQIPRKYCIIGRKWQYMGVDLGDR
jgi:hypothetical protein